MKDNVKSVVGRVIAICLLSLLTTSLLKADNDAQSPSPLENLRPHWSIEAKVGKFTPALDLWETFYEEEEAQQLSVAFAYKLWRSIELGAELSYIKDDGVGYIPTSGEIAGRTTHQLFPLHLFALYRAVFYEDQIIVPYVGGGYTRTYYRQSIEDQPSSRGDVDGGHVRYGLQILLDRADPGGSAAMEQDHNVSNSYITIEVQNLSAEIDGVELGGKSLTFGFMFEF